MSVLPVRDRFNLKEYRQKIIDTLDDIERYQADPDVPSNGIVIHLAQKLVYLADIIRSNV